MNSSSVRRTRVAEENVDEIPPDSPLSGGAGIELTHGGGRNRGGTRVESESPMPLIDSVTVGIAFDMAGCPNRCRHCYLGAPGSESLSAEDVRRLTDEFRACFTGTSVERLTVASWIWKD